MNGVRCSDRWLHKRRALLHVLLYLALCPAPARSWDAVRALSPPRPHTPLTPSREWRQVLLSLLFPLPPLGGRGAMTGSYLSATHLARTRNGPVYLEYPRAPALCLSAMTSVLSRLAPQTKDPTIPTCDDMTRTDQHLDRQLALRRPAGRRTIGSQVPRMTAGREGKQWNSTRNAKCTPEHGW